MNDKEKEIKELKERLEKLEKTDDSNESKPDKKKKSGCLIVLLVLFIIGVFMDDSTDNNEKKQQKSSKEEKYAQSRSQIIASLDKQGFNAYWSQDISLWIENPGLSQYELESFGYKLCDITKGWGYKKNYTITFWQSLRNGPSGQITKVRCYS